MIGSNPFQGLVALSCACLMIAACATTSGEVEQPGESASTAGMPAEEVVKELAPGFLEGYLSEEEQLDSAVFVLPAPAEDSAMQALDAAWSEGTFALRGTDRWDLAIRDADLHFPAAPRAFSCALGLDVDEERTPALYMLLRRTLTDIGLSTYAAKNKYQRERPFMQNGQPICTPEDEEALRKDGSYPSGHTAIGWGWALILTELAPDRTEALLARGRAFGESRNVCNVHWYSDVVAGRLAAAGAVAKLHTKETFLKAMAGARAEIESARSAGGGPEGDCNAEAKALAVSLQ